MPPDSPETGDTDHSCTRGRRVRWQARQQAVASENKKSKTYNPEAEPPRHPDSKHTHLLELVRSQALAMSLLLLLQRVCCYCRKESAFSPKYERQLARRDGAGALGRAWRSCKDRWGINKKTKRSLHYCPEWHVRIIRRRRGWLGPFINIPHAPTN